MNWSVHCHSSRKEWCVFGKNQKLILPVYQFLLSRKEGLKQNSLRAAAYDLMHIHRFLSHRGLSMETMTPKHIGQLRTWMLTPKEKREDSAKYLNVKPSFSPRSWNRLLSTLISYSEWHQGIGLNLMITSGALKKEKAELGSSKKKNKAKKTRWKVSTMEKDIEYISSKKLTLIRSHLNKRDCLIFDLIYFSGMRIGEVFSIEKNSFPPNRSTSKVIKIELKESVFDDTDRQTKSGERFIYIPNTLYQEIAQYITFKRGRTSHSLIFTTLSNSGKSKKGDPLAPDTFRKNLALACKKTGVTHRPHDLRHTLATDLFRATKDILLVKDVLGHKSVDTTEKYTHLLSEEVAATLGEVIEEIYDELLEWEVA